MNKQKLIEGIKKEKYDFSKPETSLDSSDYKEGYNDASDDILDIIKQLDEPQKVIAQIAEKWHEDIGPVLWWNFPVEEPPYCGTPLDDDFPKYKTHFTELRIPDEIEEELKWKIINDQKYCLTSIEAGYGNSLHWAFDSTKKKPILFDNEETALYTAYITGGTVEKV